MLVGGRAFVAYPYRDVRPMPEGEKVYHVADNAEAFGREHPADIALLGDIGATLAAVARHARRNCCDRGEVAARIAAQARERKHEHMPRIRAEILRGADDGRSRPTPRCSPVVDALPDELRDRQRFGGDLRPVQELMTTRPGRYFFARGGVLGCNMPAAVGAALRPRRAGRLAGRRRRRHVFAAGAVERGALSARACCSSSSTTAATACCRTSPASSAAPTPWPGASSAWTSIDPAIDFARWPPRWACRRSAPMSAPIIRAATAEALDRDGPTLIEIAVK